MAIVKTMMSRLVDYSSALWRSFISFSFLYIQILYYSEKTNSGPDP